MNRQSLAIITIIATGSILSGLAYGVTNGSIIVGDLTITGTCTGCSGETSFTNYNTISLNTTVAGGADTIIKDLKIGNDGGVTSHGSLLNRYIALNGTELFNQGSHTTPGGSQESDQSVTGTYKVMFGTGPNIINVYKNGNLLKTLGLNFAQFSGTNIAISISPNGKFIGILGEDSGAASDRIVIFQGT